MDLSLTPFLRFLAAVLLGLGCLGVMAMLAIAYKFSRFLDRLEAQDEQA